MCCNMKRGPMIEKAMMGMGMAMMAGDDDGKLYERLYELQ